MDIQITPSILNADLSRLMRKIRDVDALTTI